MSIATHGTMGVDWEQRVDFDRLRTERLDRVKAKAESLGDGGALLCFDMTNVRYITSTHIGTWGAGQGVALDAAARRTPTRSCGILDRPRSTTRFTAPGWGARNAPRAGIPLLRGAMTPQYGPGRGNR